MKINRLKVAGLFGLYNYDISFSHDGDNFTVLTSPNGYGKTTLLRVINSLDPKRLYYLYTLKFKELNIWFDDNTMLVVNEPEMEENDNAISDTQRDYRRGLLFVWMTGNREICRFEYRPADIRSAMALIKRRDLVIRHIGDEYVGENKEYFFGGELGEKLNSELAQMNGQEQFFLQLAMVQTDFIGANRIYMPSRKERGSKFRMETPIQQVVAELQQMLLKTVNDFQNNFQRLDSKFIDMLLNDEGMEISEQEYNVKATALFDKIKELASLGLTNRQTLPAFNHKNAKVLDVYLTLMAEKLRFYDDLLPLIQLFSKNVKQKHFADKSIRLSPQHGLRIESDNGDILDPDLLSTGEQNQIVLLYDLIFKTPYGSILLIDEPESSLHVAWQNDFVDDMQLIAKMKGLQIVVATHSPIIVSNTPDDQVFDLYYLQK